MTNEQKKQSAIELTIPKDSLLEILGNQNARLQTIRSTYPETEILSRGNIIRISGSKKEAKKVKALIEMMVRVFQKEGSLPSHNFGELLNGQNPFDGYMGDVQSYTIVHGRQGKPVRARTQNQKRLVESSNKNDIVFAVGPAGTGKTYTAVALAVRALKNRIVKKIILTRPAVEAGESLGFLPGDMKEKVDPYLRPLYDALEDMIPGEKLQQFMANRTIEVAPLAFMRGRTLDNAFIILDEAQNTTTSQIKMFLTRLGPSAKCIITGDLSQVDLPRHQKSGLRRAIGLLSDVKGISTIKLSADDVVRHKLVRDIIIKYNNDDEERRKDRVKKEEE